MLSAVTLRPPHAQVFPETPKVHHGQCRFEDDQGPGMVMPALDHPQGIAQDKTPEADDPLFSVGAELCSR
jgi:hypothetical protein